MTSDWKKLSSRVVEEHPIFTLRSTCFEAPRTGDPFDAVVIDSPDWVNVIALTESEDVVLIRQFRFGTERVTLEIPGGIVDPGEDPMDAARRELREETGYAGDRWQPLGAVEPNPAFLSNRLHLFLVEGCSRVGEQRQDATEDIAVELLPLGQVDAQIAAGQLSHALVMVAFQKLALLRAGHVLG